MSQDLFVNVTMNELCDFLSGQRRMFAMREKLETDKQGRKIIKRLDLFSEEDAEFSDAEDSENEGEEDPAGSESDSHEVITMTEELFLGYLSALNIYHNTLRKLRADKEGREISTRLRLFNVYDWESLDESGPLNPRLLRKS